MATSQRATVALPHRERRAHGASTSALSAFAPQEPPASRRSSTRHPWFADYATPTTPADAGVRRGLGLTGRWSKVVAHLARHHETVAAGGPVAVMFGWTLNCLDRHAVAPHDPIAISAGAAEVLVIGIGWFIATFMLGRIGWRQYFSPELG